MHRPRMFLASSQEAVDRQIVNKVVLELGEQFEMLPWYEALPAGRSFLQGLMEVAEEVDVALLIFSMDDERSQRGGQDWITRDNVVLEYGLFLGELGPDRVVIFQETGVTPPSDLLGLKTHIFTGGKDATVLTESLKQCAARVLSQFRDLDPVAHRVRHDGGIGIKTTLQAARARWEEQALLLAHHIRGHGQAAFHFRAQPSCLMAYIGALDQVKGRFWTTTFLTSAFWGDTLSKDVMDANQRMLERLPDTPDGKNARRLVILGRSLEDEADAFRSDLIHARQQGDEVRVKALNQRLKVFKERMDELDKQGFQLRVTFDDDTEGNPFPPDVPFLKHDSELAIYDDFRLDIFSGGQTGRISEVRAYCRGLSSCGALLNAAESYYESRWSRSVDGKEYLNALEKARQSAIQRIDYASNWLARYEFNLDPTDKSLKDQEFSLVEAFLTKQNLWGKIRQYLDVGTCTGRYLFKLRNAIRADGRILGIDEDAECVGFAKANRDAEYKEDDRIAIEKHDFLRFVAPANTKFNLITCMLGTLSHFGWDMRENGEDSLQTALHKFASLLADNKSVLILGKWSQYACDHNQMLGIYNKHDRKRLAKWTPSEDALRARLRKENLEVVDIQRTKDDQRLEVWFCRNAAKSGSYKRN